MKVFVNLITTFRFIYTLILPLLKVKISSIAFILNIIILFLTDSVDGILARKFKVQTLYGSMMDTIADKTLSILLLSLLIPNSKKLAIILLCEIIISIVNIIGFGKNKKTGSSLLGKIKTWSLAIAIILEYMYYFRMIDGIILDIAVVTTVIMQVFVIIGYTKSYISQKDINKQRHKIGDIKDLLYVLFDTDYYLSRV